VHPGRTGQEQQQQQQQQLQPLQLINEEYVKHWKVVRVYCAANADMMEALNTMSGIVLGCMAATGSNAEQQQQQQQQREQQLDRQQLLQQHVDGEARLMLYCAGDITVTALEAVQSMCSIACLVISQAV
jgi:hypothetical protein